MTRGLTSAAAKEKRAEHVLAFAVILTVAVGIHFLLANAFIDATEMSARATSKVDGLIDKSFSGSCYPE